MVAIGVTFRAQLLTPDRRLIEERVAHNVMTDAGLTLFAAALAWSMTEDINGTLGNPLSPTSMTPVYGAVGTGTGFIPTSSDVQLITEIGRTQAQAVAVGNTTVAWYFEWGLTQANGTIGEVGLFGRATGGANTGTMLDHAPINPVLEKIDTTLLVYQATLTVTGGN